MPELPEVETIRRSLTPHLVGRQVTQIVVRNRALRVPVDSRALARRVEGRRIAGLGRRAKYLLVEMEGGEVLVLHLGMSGRLTVVPVAVPLDHHDHVLFRLSERAGRPPEELRLRDPRRFGMVVVLAAARLEQSPIFRHLGPEPLAEGGALDAALLRARARGRRVPVKNLLLDARLLVGVGNIYACESLYAAGIDPRTPAGRLGPRRWERVLGAVREVLRSSIAEGGTSLNDYRDGDGRPGLYQVGLQVYGRTGEPCRRCGRRIRRIVQSGRSTFFCSRCQR
jgi:formamidopyrimidine-DNA glycosylase